MFKTFEKFFWNGYNDDDNDVLCQEVDTIGNKGNQYWWWFHCATSYYLNECWSSSMMPYDIVNNEELIMLISTLLFSHFENMLGLIWIYLCWIYSPFIILTLTDFQGQMTNLFPSWRLQGAIVNGICVDHWQLYAEIILCMRSANERRCYIVTSSPIDWVHTQNDPCACEILVNLKCAPDFCLMLTLL